MCILCEMLLPAMLLAIFYAEFTRFCLLHPPSLIPRHPHPPADVRRYLDAIATMRTGQQIEWNATQAAAAAAGSGYGGDSSGGSSSSSSGIGGFQPSSSGDGVPASAPGPWADSSLGGTAIIWVQVPGMYGGGIAEVAVPAGDLLDSAALQHDVNAVLCQYFGDC